MSGLRSVFTYVLCATAAQMLLETAAVAQPFEFAVERDRFFGSSSGILTFDADTVVYATDERDDARIWAYRDIKQVQVLSATAVTIKTYEDQAWMRLGADRAFEFELTDGTVPTALASFLAERVDQPLVLAVFPPSAEEPRFQVPVKLRQRVRGSDGTLAVYDHLVVYETTRGEHARQWRVVDLYAVFQPDRHRLTFEVYEGGGDNIRDFAFDLKADLPPGFLDLLWRRLYTPDLARIGPRDGSR